MKLNLGPYTLSLTTSKPRSNNVGPLIAARRSYGPFIDQSEDQTSLNVAFIRETVSACMHVRSEAIGKGTFGVYLKTKTDVTGHGLQPANLNNPVSSFLEKFNPVIDLGDLLEIISQWLDAAGNALILKIRNSEGKVIELWPIPCFNFDILRGEDHLPEKYIFRDTNTSIPAEDIIHIKRNDLRTAPFLGHAILSDIISTARTSAALKALPGKVFDNDSVPRAVMTFPSGTLLTQEQMDLLRLQWEEKYMGAENSSSLAIMPDGGDIHSVTPGKEIDFQMSNEMLRNAIREAFRVPRVALGDTDNINLANADTSYIIFARDVVDYLLRKIARALNNYLLPELDPNYILVHQSSVPAHEERVKERLAILHQFATVNEARAMINLPPAAQAKIGDCIIHGNYWINLKTGYYFDMLAQHTGEVEEL